MSIVSAEEIVRANKEFYSGYWNQRWKYLFMYDMQIKKKLFLYALERSGITRRQKRVLDIGFGSGDILFSFDGSCELFGVDFSQNAVDGARRYAVRKGYRSTKFLQLDLDEKSLPFENESLDIVICSHVLEHLIDDMKMIREIHRTLRKEGMGIILIPINEKPGEDPNHLRLYKKDSFLSQLATMDFDVRFVHESESVWRLVGWFFTQGYHERIPFLGSVISGLINVPLALLPFSVHRRIDKLSYLFGCLPRQAVFCFQKM